MSICLSMCSVCAYGCVYVCGSMYVCVCVYVDDVNPSILTC